MISDHGIQDEEQLPHAGGEGNLFWLACGKQSSIKRLDHRIESSSYQGGHVQSSPHRCAATPHFAFASQSATIPVERSDPYQGGNLVAVQFTQFRQLRQQNTGYHRAYSRNTQPLGTSPVTSVVTFSSITCVAGSRCEGPIASSQGSLGTHLGTKDAGRNCLPTPGLL